MRPMKGAVRAVSCIALACALCVPAIAGQTDYLLKLGGVDGDTKAQTQDDKHKNQIEILSYSWGDTRSADALTDGLLIMRNHDQQPARTSKVDAFTIKQGASSAAQGGVSVAAGDVTGDGHAAKTGTPVYLNRTRQKDLLTPASAGSVALKVAPGHGLCTAGKGLGTLTLQGAGGRSYALHGVTVVGCEATASGDRPTETLTLNYARIEY
jgi:hypothetical protein